MDNLIRSRIAPFVAFVLASVGSIHAGSTIQFDVKSLLNIRVVTTFTGGRVVTFDQGVDGWDGEATFAAADEMHSNNGNCMNNDGKYPATTSHPDIVLNYSDAADANSFQARKMVSGETLNLTVPPGKYSWLGFYFMSSFGASSVGFQLKYADNSSTIFSGQIPDWYPGDLEGKPSYLFLVASNLAKWDVNNTRPEPDRHSLYGISIPVDKNKVLKEIVFKQSSGGYCTMWGGTGTMESVSALATKADVSGGLRLESLTGNRVRLGFGTAGGRWELVDQEGAILSRGSSAGSEVVVAIPSSGMRILRVANANSSRVFKVLAK